MNWSKATLAQLPWEAVDGYPGVKWRFLGESQEDGPWIMHIQHSPGYVEKKHWHEADTVYVFTDGEMVVDGVVMENYWERKANPDAPSNTCSGREYLSRRLDRPNPPSASSIRSARKLSRLAPVIPPTRSSRLLRKTTFTASFACAREAPGSSRPRIRNQLWPA